MPEEEEQEDLAARGAPPGNEEDGGTGGDSGDGDAGGADAAKKGEPEVSPDSDPIVVEAEDAPRPGLMSRLNPLKMFRRTSPETFVKDGREMMENQSYAQATVAFNQALQLDPNHLGALRGLGKVFFKKGGRSNLNTSLKYYQEAIQKHPKENDLYAISSKIYDTLGKRKEATLERKKYVIVRALDADPKNHVANNNMGILFLQQGRPQEALSYFQKSIDSDKNYDIAYRNLAAVYYQMAKSESDESKKSDYNNRASKFIQKAVDIAPTPPSLLALARVKLKEGHFDEVLALVDKLDEMIPANKDVYQVKKMALEGLGRFEEATNAGNSMAVFAQGSPDAPQAAESEEEEEEEEEE